MGIPWENDAKTWRIDVLQMFRVNDDNGDLFMGCFMGIPWEFMVFFMGFFMGVHGI